MSPRSSRRVSPQYRQQGLGVQPAHTVATGQQVLSQLALSAVQGDHLFLDGVFHHQTVYRDLALLSYSMGAVLAWSSTAGFHQGSR
ncbi:Uncharacterised protein [Klebsiella pneumoniae]|uniref:Uncharacterized protein n=1 Tax=Klebsiella pneumoniae TaxID=573 RepID=A0A378F3S0_KLEPN|nr:Uncharacterised protein [Klebsiella pneumoniae]